MQVKEIAQNDIFEDYHQTESACYMLYLLGAWAAEPTGDVDIPLPVISRPTAAACAYRPAWKRPRMHHELMNQVPWSSNAPNRRPTFFLKKITNNQKSNDHALCWCLSAFSLGQPKSCHLCPPKSGRLDPTQTLGRLHVIAGPIPWSL